MSKEELLFPSFNYYLDESDPDMVILRRQDGTFVAAFSAQGATKEGIVKAATASCSLATPRPGRKGKWRTVTTRGLKRSSTFRNYTL